MRTLAVALALAALAGLSAYAQLGLGLGIPEVGTRCPDGPCAPGSGRRPKR
jgi:hypothetical protein